MSAKSGVEEEAGATERFIVFMSKLCGRRHRQRTERWQRFLHLPFYILHYACRCVVYNFRHLEKRSPIIRCCNDLRAVALCGWMFDLELLHLVVSSQKMRWPT
jgi:hypothetical protein